MPGEEQDPDLAEKLLDEAPAILNWMLDGLDRLMNQSGFTNEGDVEDKREIADAWGSLFDRIAHHFLETTGHPEDIVHKSELHALYVSHGEQTRKATKQQAQFTKNRKQLSGVSDRRSRRIDDAEDDRSGVFTGIRVDGETIKENGLDVPAHAFSEDSDGDRPGQQSIV